MVHFSSPNESQLISVQSHDKLSRKSMMSDFQAMSSDSGIPGLETAWKRLRLDEKEEGEMEMTTEDVATAYAGHHDRSFCLLGRFLIEKNYKFSFYEEYLSVYLGIG